MSDEMICVNCAHDESKHKDTFCDTYYSNGQSCQCEGFDNGLKKVTNKLLKVEIGVIGHNWEWIGAMDEESLTKLCAYADELSDQANEKVVGS